ncbi:MAG TPA: uracil-DNA glycosylase [Crenotrichaceae bacterium]|nr:uracil-DNA glycosylase [Crenotrichaceae bacterium]
MESCLRFDINCRLCPRLSDFLDQVSLKHPHYHARPVDAFGPLGADLLIVGLAPGMHGANATGRPFTGDYAGILLYETLYQFGFSNQAVSTHCDDGLELFNCRITNAVKCLPPANKPVSSEINQCNAYLARELNDLSEGSVILALGTIAHKAVIKAAGMKQAEHPFAHNTVHPFADKILVDSYHCSRYNVQTRRLTTPMFHQVFRRIQTLLAE